jgi:hypothetical protein
MGRVVSFALLLGLAWQSANEAIAQDTKPKPKPVPVQSMVAIDGFVGINGKVETGDKKSLKNALVAVFDIESEPVKALDKDGNPVNPGTADEGFVRTGDNGEYSFYVRRKDFRGTQEAIGYILYEHPQWHPQLVEILSSAGETMEINKLLPLATGPSDYVETIRQIQIYEFLMSASQGSRFPIVNTTTVADFRTRIQQLPHPLDTDRTDATFVNAMKKLDGDKTGLRKKEQARRLNLLLSAYGLPTKGEGLSQPPSRGRASCFFCCW